MTYPLQNPTTIFNQSIPLQKGYKLGTSATWKNIKKQASNSYNLIKDIEAVKSSQESAYDHIEIGFNNEIFINFDGLIELWKVNTQNDLVFINQFDLRLNSNKKIEKFKVIRQTDKSYIFLFQLKEIDSGTYSFQLRELIMSKRSRFVITNFLEDLSPWIPSQFQVAPFQLRTSSNFIVIINSLGSLKTFDVKGRKVIPLKLNLTTELNEINDPVIDLINNWMVLSLNEENLINLKGLLNDKLNSKNQINLTCLRLPQKKHLLQKLLMNLSNSAIDGFLKLSEASSKKIIKYLNKNKELHSNGVNENNESNIGEPNKHNTTFIQSTLNNLLYQSKKGSLMIPSKQILCIIDLKNLKILSIFKPPEGVTHVSLSPFDLSLATINKRGNNMYMYDLSRLSKEISIIGNFTKGKTKSTIRQIKWFKNNQAIGFVTNPSGSIHWFNLTTKNQSVKDLEISKDNWILSSVNSYNVSILSNQKIISVNHLNEIIFINYLNGEYSTKIDLPKTPIDNRQEVDKFLESSFQENVESQDDSDPLSKVEIETCSPYPNLYNDNHFKISTYNFEEWKNEYKNTAESASLMKHMNDDTKLFLKLFENFGNGFKANDIIFKNEVQIHSNEINGFNDKTICDKTGNDYFEDLIIDQGEEIIKL